MKRVLAIIATLIIVAAVMPAHAADDKDDLKHWYKNGLKFESKDKKFSVQFGSRVQFRFTHDDPETGSSTDSFRVRRAKFSIKGKVYEHWKYKIQAVWSGGSTSLEDAYFQYTRVKAAQLWAGQGKAMFGRQQLTSSGSQQFVDRAITDSRFVPAREQGVALIGNVADNQFEYNVGIYNGNGRNVSSNDDGDFMYTVRAVYTPFGSYKPEESSLDYPEGPKLAVGVKALATTDPSGGVAADIDRAGAEVAFKIVGFNLVGEYFQESRKPAVGMDVDSDGFYFQTGYLFPDKKSEVALRYAKIDSDDMLSTADNMTEKGIGFSYYLARHKYKVQADYRMLENDVDPTLDTDQIRVQLQLAF